MNKSVEYVQICKMHSWMQKKKWIGLLIVSEFANTFNVIYHEKIIINLKKKILTKWNNGKMKIPSFVFKQAIY